MTRSSASAPARLRLGKFPARPDAVKFKLSRYLDAAKLPTPPAKFGHQALVTVPWAMLRNDRFGDCVWADVHETMLWCREAGVAASFTDATVLSDYAAVTGFDPNRPDTDQGSAAASYRRKTGVVDSLGHRHTVDAYLAIKPGDIAELKLAAYLFGAVGIGIEFPSSAMSQFDAGKPWSGVPRARVEGGHYVPCVGFDGTDFLVVTWGKIQRVTPGFLRKYCDEAIAYVSLERLTAGRSLDGFELAAPRADPAALPAA